jgi:hypothetical protein
MKDMDLFEPGHNSRRTVAVLKGTAEYVRWLERLSHKARMSKRTCWITPCVSGPSSMVIRLLRGVFQDQDERAIRRERVGPTTVRVIESEGQMAVRGMVPRRNLLAPLLNREPRRGPHLPMTARVYDTRPWLIPESASSADQAPGSIRLR